MKNSKTKDEGNRITNHTNISCSSGLIILIVIVAAISAITANIPITVNGLSILFTFSTAIFQGFVGVLIARYEI